MLLWMGWGTLLGGILLQQSRRKSLAAFAAVAATETAGAAVGEMGWSGWWTPVCGRVIWGGVTGGVSAAYAV